MCFNKFLLYSHDENLTRDSFSPSEKAQKFNYSKVEFQKNSGGDTLEVWIPLLRHGGN
jgi:hypothetical protein